MSACTHPAARRYAWFAYGETGLVDTLCVCCCDCGAVLQGSAGPAADETTPAITPATPAGPDPDAAIEALRLAHGIVQAHNLCAPTASEAERTATIARFITWWNYIALPALTGEPAPDWAAPLIDTIYRSARMELCP